MPTGQEHHLPRLERRNYQAFAAVHWIMCVQPKEPGWLDDRFHQEFRELLVHTCIRERLFCPVYCLMPDHVHLMWLGLSLASDQLNGMKFAREHLSRVMAGESLNGREKLASRAVKWSFQFQAYDHGLREEERMRDTFARVCFYILENPVRAELVGSREEWLYSGCVIPGYPKVHPFNDNYWPLFWKLYYQFREDVSKDPISST